MRSVRFDSFGDPTKVLWIEDIPTPEPGPNEVLIRLSARSINPSDLLTVSGQYGVLPKLPATPGYEGAGVIAALGEGVKGLEVGQRVVPLGANQGTWQEFVTARAAAVLPIPESISDVQAAMLLVNPPTAWIMLTDTLKVQHGEWILQTAAGSAVGTWVIKIAKQLGAKTINVVRRSDQAATLKALGGDEVICTADENIMDRVMQITGNKGANYALDAVGGDVGSQALSALARRGTMITYGLLSGEPIKVDVGRMLFRETVLRGFWLTLWLRFATPEQIAAVFGAVVPMLAGKQAESPVEATYDLGEITQAVTHAAQAGRNGKIVLVG